MVHGPARNLPILDPCHRNPNLCMGLNKNQGKEVWMDILHDVENENEKEDMLKTRTSFKRSKKNCSEVEREANNTTADQSLRERGRA
jgi:hypothetical protein